MATEVDYDEEDQPPDASRTSQTVWRWEFQGAIIKIFQRTPWLLAFVPSIIFHFIYSRDWGLAIGPFLAFALFGDHRCYDLFFGASLAAIICGSLKHIFRTPRPFWVVPGVYLKHGVEEMSWAMPCYRSAIQGAISAILIYQSDRSMLPWAQNCSILAFVMLSRLYLGVHWPQDVVVGAIIGIPCGIVVSWSKIHTSMVNFAQESHPHGGLIFISLGIGYFGLTSIIANTLEYLSIKNAIPARVILKYKLGLARSCKLLMDPALADDDLESTMARCRKCGKRNCGEAIVNSASTTNSSNPYEVTLRGQEVPPGDHRSRRERQDRGFHSSGREDFAGGSTMQLLARQHCVEYFLSQEEFKNEEKRKLKINRELGVFMRKDEPFDPDQTGTLWYNGITVLGAYTGVALYCSLADVEDVRLNAKIPWLISIYGSGLALSTIIYARTILRSAVTKRPLFTALHVIVCFLVSIFAYGLFPLSYQSFIRELKTGNSTEF